MERPNDPPEVRRFRLALDLFEFGERVMRQNLRRRHPDASEEQIENLLRRWLARSDESKAP